MTFTTKHSRIYSGEFPKKELEELLGITVNIEHTKKFGEDLVTITIDETLLIQGEDINSVIFELGMLAHSWCNINKYK